MNKKMVFCTGVAIRIIWLIALNVSHNELRCLHLHTVGGADKISFLYDYGVELFLSRVKY
jgi:hypothetical protein